MSDRPFAHANGTTFSWARLWQMLEARALSPHDVADLIAAARGTRFQKRIRVGDRDLSLEVNALETLHDEPEAFGFSTTCADELLLDLVDALSVGPPAGPLRPLWELLFTEGCPLSRIGLLTSTCMLDPDEACAWHHGLRESVDDALTEARRYRDLGFPFRRGPYQQLGAQVALDAAVSCRMLSVPALWTQIHALRRAVSPALRARLAESSGLLAGLQRVLPAHEIASGWTLDDEDWWYERARQTESDPDRSPLDPGEFVPERWIDTLARWVDEGLVLRDPVLDTFVLTSEPRLPLVLTPRVLGPAPEPRHLQTVIDSLELDALWKAASDPLVWLVEAMETAAERRHHTV